MSAEATELLAVACIGLALRSIISTYSYSGCGVAPMFGDYEAQRHWQEVTVNLDTSKWYQNSTDNDLLYWGLDYPPLTAYHSYFLGKIAKTVDKRFVELHQSKGYESKEHKNFMRLTVLAADFIVYIPAVLILCICIDRTFQCNVKLPLFLLFMLYPGQMLIDNGHFQYNNISLGLTALAIAAILLDRHCLAALAFTLALNYKQMELYHALPFFAYLLSTCCSKKSLSAFVSQILKIGLVVVATFTILWWPWIQSLDTVLSLVHRLFPIGRGVFEDKVSNFWCALNVCFKLRMYFTNQTMALVCLAFTLLAAIPTNVELFFRGNKLKFILALFNTALAFFLFAFQVHEKSILLVALPACCLCCVWPTEMFWFLEVSVFSMMPLLAKDNLLMPTIALTAIFYITHSMWKNYEVEASTYNIVLNRVRNFSELSMLAITFTSQIVKPPVRYPDLWPLIISVVSCAHFMSFLLWGNFQQFRFKI